MAGASFSNGAGKPAENAENGPKTRKTGQPELRTFPLLIPGPREALTDSSSRQDTTATPGHMPARFERKRLRFVLSSTQRDLLPFVPLQMLIFWIPLETGKSSKQRKGETWD